LNRPKTDYFDSQVHAEWAAPDYGPEEMQKIDYLLTEADIRRGFRIHEPGCGTGRLTEILADRVGPTGLVVALDMSTKMVEACRRRVGSRPNVRIHCSSVEEFSAGEANFDLVICHNVFPHFDSKVAAVGILASGLKRSGRIIVFHFMNSVHINAVHRKLPPPLFNDLMPTDTEMESFFKQAGLKIDFLLDDDQGYFLSASNGIP
jgi:ubiquinone/menaquinone biosynthesis C-methylase UbiE